MPSCVTEETADVRMFLTQGAEYGPPPAVYTAETLTPVHM